MKRPDDKKKHVKIMESRTAYYLGLGIPLFTYASIIVFQLLRFLGIPYSLLFWDLYITIRVHCLLPIPEFQKIYYYYTDYYITNRLIVFIYKLFYWEIVFIWFGSISLFSVFLELLNWYIITIDLLLDLTRFFIFYVDTDLDEFIRKHPVLDAKTEFLVDRWFLDLVSYCTYKVPSFYTYIFRYIFHAYDSLCSLTWTYVRANHADLALVYSIISLPYFTLLLMFYWINSNLTFVAENHFSLLILFTGWMNSFLYWSYSYLYRYDFLNSFYMPAFLDFLYNHRHPRGINLIIFIAISEFIDRIFKTKILFSICMFIFNLAIKIKKFWINLKKNKPLLFVLTVVFWVLPTLT